MRSILVVWFCLALGGPTVSAQPHVERGARSARVPALHRMPRPEAYVRSQIRRRYFRAELPAALSPAQVHAAQRAAAAITGRTSAPGILGREMRGPQRRLLLTAGAGQHPSLQERFRFAQEQFGLDAEALRETLTLAGTHALQFPVRVTRLEVGMGLGGRSWHTDTLGLRDVTIVVPLGREATGVRFRTLSGEVQHNGATLHGSGIEHGHGAGPRIRAWLDLEAPNSPAGRATISRYLRDALR